MTFIRKQSDGNGGEVRSISLVLFVSIVGALCSVITALGAWSLAAMIIPEQVATRTEARVEARLQHSADDRQELHKRIDRVEDRLNKHLEGGREAVSP